MALRAPLIFYPIEVLVCCVAEVALLITPLTRIPTYTPFINLLYYSIDANQCHVGNKITT